MKAPLSISRAMKITDIVDFIPGKLDSRFKEWKNKGITVLDDLFEGEILLSFDQLKEKFGLRSTDSCS